MKRRRKNGITTNIVNIFTNYGIYWSLGFGLFFLTLGVFLTFVIFNIGGQFGNTVDELLFTYLGYTYWFVIPISISLAFALLFPKDEEHITNRIGRKIVSFSFLPTILTTFFFILPHNTKQPIRSTAGLLFFFLIMPTFISISFGDTAGGYLGVYFSNIIINILGGFSYVLIPVLLLINLLVLNIFSIRGIINWLVSEKQKEEEEEDYEEEEEDELDEDEEYEDEEPEEEEEELDEEEEEDYEEEEEEEEPEPKPKRISKKYILPSLSILSGEKGVGVEKNTKTSAQALERTLKKFKIDVEVEEVTVGPTFTRYSLRPAEGVRLSKIISLQNNLELALAAHPIRIEAPIPGQSLVGIEVPNQKKSVVGLRQMLSGSEFKKATSLPLIFGKTITGDTFIKSLSKMPHILVAGTTGSGKSVLIHNLVLSLIYKYSPEELKFIFIDPKRVELTLYENIPHLYAQPITGAKEAMQALNWAVLEMEKRYEKLEVEKCRGIDAFNKVVKPIDRMPYLVIVVDELADLMQSYPKEIEKAIVRIAQKSRAVGIHLILSTQRPSVNVLTGLVKANIPVRTALQVSSQIDSRTIIDMPGAENLSGNGDLLYTSAENKKPVRVQSAFVSEEEVKEVVEDLIEKNGSVDDLIDFKKQKNNIQEATESDDEDDELYEEAKEIVIGAKKASTSLLQRKLRVGYSRAARLIDLTRKEWSCWRTNRIKAKRDINN